LLRDPERARMAQVQIARGRRCETAAVHVMSRANASTLLVRALSNSLGDKSR
jgi:hypothetical protein